MLYYVHEYYRQRGLWKWRFVFENGERRKVLATSDGAYKRWVDCARSWNAVRGHKHQTRKAGGKRLV